MAACKDELPSAPWNGTNARGHAMHAKWKPGGFAMRWIVPIAVIALFGVALHAPANAQTFPERDRAAVVDAAGVIPDEAEAALAARLVAWNRETGHQLVVVTIPTLEGYEIQDYGYRLLRHWRLGRAGADDGVILMLAPDEREVRIEVGYGLEAVLTDALSGRIIRETIRPALQADDIGGALTGGAERIMAAATADPADTRAMTLAAERESRRGPSIWLILLVGTVIVLVGLYILDRRFSAAMAREKAEWENKSAKWEKARRARQLRRWEKLKAEGKTTFDTFEDFYADFLARQEAREKASRMAAARHDTASPRSSAYSDSDRWSASEDYGGGNDYSSGDSGFDGGGGSGGGGGADSRY